jgi:hypothetical protein
MFDLAGFFYPFFRLQTVIRVVWSLCMGAIKPRDDGGRESLEPQKDRISKLPDGDMSLVIVSDFSKCSSAQPRFAHQGGDRVESFMEGESPSSPTSAVSRRVTLSPPGLYNIIILNFIFFPCEFFGFSNLRIFNGFLALAFFFFVF